MRYSMYFVAICAVVILLQARTAIAYHDLTCHPPPPPHGGGDNFFDIFVDLAPAEGLNLIVPGVGGATSSSCGDAGGGHIEVALPPDSVSAVEHISSTGRVGRFWLFESVSRSFRDARLGMSSELPNFTKSDGTPLLTQYNESNLDFLLSTARTFTPGEEFAVSSGEIVTWSGATLLELPASFTLDELLAADPSRFAAYTGLAAVAKVATIKVIPEPTACTLALVALGLTIRRRR